MSRVIFVSYASGSYKKNIFWNKWFVKFFIRPHKCVYFTDEDLKNDAIYTNNRRVLDAKVGAGYWAWKPWAILQAMEMSEHDDIILYQDCGKGLRYKNIWRPKNIIREAVENGIFPGVTIPEHGLNRDWTHEKCFLLMNCYAEEYFVTPQVEAVISAWKVNPISKGILIEWLNFCLDYDVISEAGIEEQSQFASKGHRYDQSVLTNLVVKHDLKPLQQNAGILHLFKCMWVVDICLSRNKTVRRSMFSIVSFSVSLMRRIRALLKRG